MSGTSFDMIVIGSGPGGYVCAIRAAQLGLTVAVVEKAPTLGGTCLNVGCIPSKALLESSHLYEEVGQGLGAHGITVEPPVLDLAAMMARKDRIVADNVKGVEFLLKKHKIKRFSGEGRIEAPGFVEVAAAEGPVRLEAKHIVIATGSETASLDVLPIDEERILSSTGALRLSKVPARLAVVGAGVIGLELGSVWRRLGAAVTVVEFTGRVLPQQDAEISKHAQRLFARQGMTFRLGTKVTGAALDADGVHLTLEPAGGGASQTLDADAVLVAAGRRPVTRGLGLEALGVALDERGFIAVDAHYATSQPGLYAIGDVIGGPQLAHKAEDEGVALAERLAGQAGHVSYDAVPSVVYTRPEIASVGRTEEELKAAGIAYKSGKFPFSANGRARTLGETDGFVKILADAATDRVLGAHIIGPSAGDLIAEIVLGMEFSAAAEDIARTMHAHPGLGEAVREAALDVAGGAIHI